MIRGNNLYLRALTTEDVGDLLALEQTNRSFFENFSMDRSEEFYTEQGQLRRMRLIRKRRENDEEYHYGIFLQTQQLIGVINLFQVYRGPLQRAFIGYFLDKSYNGRGYMTEAVKLLVNEGFDKLQLHRIEAGVIPHNIGSIRVLEKAGFHKEGIAKKNVKINGVWEDHQVLARLNPADE
ncbi:GNAT family N-acetyltransferase [Virgibacillus salexigens]|uniref:Putative ribosomal N-acetyltransferase YdaF n=1 Tax=Virgibacillus massiliensis TaxID=1462526 RepID=A0A024Q6S0_9BACI|nr:MULTISPECIES: GNAT family protein [Virgibacillus]CDQ37910.1 Putative ribosomal N-acetyltransferase YdaF [Virgibacillus massiliensis]